MPTLTDKQLEIAGFLAAEMSQNEAAKRAGVGRSTVQRYLKLDEFRAEVDRRRRRAEQIHQEEADRVQRESISEFYDELKEYTRSLADTYKTRLSRGLKIQQKMGRRIDDLPDEAFTPRDTAALLGVSDQMIEKAFQGWAELLALNELLEKLNGDKERS